MEKGLLLIESLLSHTSTMHTTGMLRITLSWTMFNTNRCALGRMVNIAGLAALVTTFLKKYVGFWAAFIPPAVAMALGMIPLMTFRNKFGESL